MTYCALPCSCSDSSVETVETVHLAVQAKPCHSMGLELTAPTRSKQVVDVHPEAMTQANGGSSSIAGVLLCVVVVAASLMLLPLAGVTVLLAALAGFWWLSTGSSCAAVQMNALTAESVAEAGAVDMDAAQLVEATEKQV